MIVVRRYRRRVDCTDLIVFRKKRYAWTLIVNAIVKWRGNTRVRKLRSEGFLSDGLTPRVLLSASLNARMYFILSATRAKYARRNARHDTRVRPHTRSIVEPRAGISGNVRRAHRSRIRTVEGYLGGGPRRVRVSREGADLTLNPGQVIHLHLEFRLRAYM